MTSTEVSVVACPFQDNMIPPEREPPVSRVDVSRVCAVAQYNMEKRFSRRVRRSGRTPRSIERPTFEFFDSFRQVNLSILQNFLKEKSLKLGSEIAKAIRNTIKV